MPKGKAAINLISKAKIPAKAWQKAAPREWLAGGTPLCDNNMSEAEVIIRSGELMVGVMDKTHYGATPYGLIHSMYELYGGTCSTQLLSSFAKMFTIFLQREGFTLGVHDILVLPNADKKRKKIIRKSRLVSLACYIVSESFGFICTYPLFRLEKKCWLQLWLFPSQLQRPSLTRKWRKHTYEIQSFERFWTDNISRP